MIKMWCNNFFSRCREIWSRDGIRKYSFNTGWMLGDKIICLTANLIVSIYVARYLGPEEFGVFNYAISLVAIFSPIATLGLDGIVVRELVKFPHKHDVLLGSAFWLKIGGSIVLFSSVIALVLLNNGPQLDSALVIIIAGSMLLSSFQVYDFHNQAAVKMRHSAVASVAANICQTLLALWLVLSSADLIWFAFLIVLQKGVQALVWGGYYRQNGGRFFRWRFSFTQAIILLRDSWPLMLSALTVMVYMKVDQVMLKWMISDHAVGEYSVAVKLSEVWYFVPMIISQSLFPAIVNAREVSEVEYKKRLQRLLNLMSKFSCVVIIATFFLGDFIVLTLFGEKYSGAADILAIHIFALIFVSFGVVSGNWLLAENETSLSFWRTFVGMIFNVFLNCWFIPLWGGIGAAWATLISYAIAGYFFDMCCPRMRWLIKYKTYSLFALRVN